VDVTLGFDTLDGYLGKNPFFGCIAGRYANRIGNATFKLDGVEFKVTANSGKHQLHGGKEGFDKKLWSAKEIANGVALSYTSPDGEEGYPGTLKSTVTYTLTDDNGLQIDYQATTDKPTVLNLTNHAYFNLSGGGSCVDNILTIPAKRYTPSDNELIPTGEILPVEGTPVDFRKPTRVGERFSQLRKGLNGYDHNFVLGGSRRLKFAARLSDPASGRVMEVKTTQPAIQLYTGNHLGNTAVCLETQYYPDAIHHANFPSIVVRPGKPQKDTTVFTFRTDRR
jgi:aldose 1-epimerase